jgi:osmoprotectant transport system permease protein
MEGAISAEAMIGMNGSVELDRRPETAAAEAFVESRIGLAAKSRFPGAAERIRDRTLEHLDLVRKSLIPAILVAIPLGILAARARKSGPMILAAVGIVQTIPALALLVMLMPAVSALGARSVGLGSATAIVALFLYSLLPIVRNTVAGLRGIAREHQEAARALGLTERFRLTTIDLPLASPSILAGIKTAAVINVGFATLGALVGAGGYGQPILTGIRLNDTALILEGAVPAAVLALLVQGGFELLERYLVPRGLRTPRASL